jgi:hypothetical protein
MISNYIIIICNNVLSEICDSFQLGPRFGELCVGIVTDFVVAVAGFVSHTSEPALAVINFVVAIAGLFPRTSEVAWHQQNVQASD